jgi:hypothetical protein
MGVDHGGLDIGVAKQFLDRTDIITVLQQMSGEAVPESVGGDVFGQASTSSRLPDSTPHS